MRLCFPVSRVSIMLLGWGLALLLGASGHAEGASLTEARALIDQGKDAEAAAMLNGLVAAMPDDYQRWFMLGVAEAHRKNLQAAIRAFRKVTELRPDLAEAHNNLAVIYNEIGDWQAAIKELQTALALDPDYATAYENIGDLYIKLAQQAYQKALIIEENPELERRYQRLLHLRDAVEDLAGSDTPHHVSPAKVGVWPDALPQKSGGDAGIGSARAEEAAGLPADVRAAVLAAVERWRSAWSARDLAAYFAAYAEDFKPDGRFSDQRAWRRYKRRVISSKTFIDVKLEDIQLLLESEKRARVEFVQDFDSNNYHSRDRKRLILERREDGWKIVDEQVL